MLSWERQGTTAFSLLRLSDIGGWLRLHRHRDGCFRPCAELVGHSSGQHPSSSMANLLWAGAVSRTLGLSTEHPASRLDTTRKNANGLFVDSVTLPPATPLGYVEGTRGGHSGAQLPHFTAPGHRGRGSRTSARGLFHQQLNCLLFIYTQHDESRASGGGSS